MVRRTQAELDRLAPRVVQLKFEQRGARVPPCTDSELLDACHEDDGLRGVTNVKDVRRLVERAFRRGLARVRVDVHPQPRPLRMHGPRSAAVSAVLEARNLRARAWVYDHGDPSIVEDEVHRDLAWAAGKEAIERQLVSPDGRLCFGAGRSVYWFLRSFASSVDMPLEDVTLYSLCGSSERGAGVEPGSLNSDALLTRFEEWAEDGGHSPPRSRFCTLPIALPESNMTRGRRSLLRRHAGYLLDDWWEKRKPDLVVSGLDLIDAGSLAEPVHPFLISRSPAIHGLDPKPIEVLADNPGEALAEVLHYPWVVGTEPRPTAVVELADRLQSRVVAPLPSGLAHARHRMVIAGGGQKSDALVDYVRRAATDDNVMSPTILVTDARGADALLADGIP